MNKELNIILKKDFTKKQEDLAQKLFYELRESSGELDEFSVVSIFGLKETKKGSGSILFEIDYDDPEKNGELTLFCNY
jgi:hypothetical protein